MIASVAMATLLALGATAALRAVLLLTQALARAEPPPSLYQGHLPAPMPTRRQERMAAVLVCVVFGAILILLAGRAPAPRPPVPEVTGLDHLQAKVERLDARRTLALDAAASCPRACLTGVASFSVRESEALCACRVVASLGVHRVPRQQE